MQLLETSGLSRRSFLMAAAAAGGASMLPCLALLGAAILLTLVGTQLPGRLALRARPVDSIGIKQ